MGDETARLRIEADVNDLAAAKETVERLHEELNTASTSVNRGAAGWQAQSRAVAELTSQLERAQREYKELRSAMAAGTPVDYGRVAVNLPASHPLAQRRQGAPATPSRDPTATSSIDTNRAGRMSMVGMGLANTAQDAYYNPAYAVNNIMGMVQMSGGVKALGADLLELGGTVAKTVTRFSPLNIAIAASGAALYGVHGALKDAGLGWGDLLSVIGRTTPITTASAAIEGSWDTLSDTTAGKAAVSTWDWVSDGITGFVGDLAEYTLGWDAATAATKAHNEELEKAAKRAKDVEAAVNSLGDVRSESQARQVEEGKALVQRLADLGGEDGVSGAMGRISSIGPNGKAGNEAAGEVAMAMKAAREGDATAISNLTAWAKQAGMDPGEIVTDREKRERTGASTEISKVIDADLDNVTKRMSDRMTDSATAVDELDAAIDRINRVIERGVLTNEDYAKVIERVNTLKKESVSKENDELARQGKENEAAFAPEIEEAERLNQRKASREEKRIENIVDQFGESYAPKLFQRMLAGDQRGEDAGQLDQSLTQQVSERLKRSGVKMTDEQRLDAASRIVQERRENVDDFAMQRQIATAAQRERFASNMAPQGTFLGTMQRQQLARFDQQQASGGLAPEGTFIGVAQRQMLARQGIDPDAVARMGTMAAGQAKAGSPESKEQKQEKATDKFASAVDKLDRVVSNIQVIV